MKRPERTRLLRMGLTIALALALGASAAIAKDQRRRMIEFDDEVVEGMNKRPLDSLSQISEKERMRNRPHLYHKRVGFRSETSETLHEMRYSP